jgi:PAS domain S-box-containing protein
MFCAATASAANKPSSTISTAGQSQRESRAGEEFSVVSWGKRRFVGFAGLCLHKREIAPFFASALWILRMAAEHFCPTLDFGMESATWPSNEPARQHALDVLQILDTPDEQEFDDITALASFLCQTPIALISLVDRERQWFKSRLGIGVQELPRAISVCGHTILGDDILEISDTLADRRFADNPLVVGETQIRFYAGMPLHTADHHNIGTLCVADRQPRQLTEEQKAALRCLARQVVRLFDLRSRTRRETELRQKLYSETELSRATITHAGVPIISTDLQGVIRSFNPAAEDLLGYDAAEMVGRATVETLQDAAELRKAADEISAEAGRPVGGAEALVWPLHDRDLLTVEGTYLRKDGGRVPVLLTISKLQDETGQPFGFLAVVRDLTAVRREEGRARLVSRIMDVSRVAQEEFIAGRETPALMESLLERIMELTGSAYGFVVEVGRDAAGRPFLPGAAEFMTLQRSQNGRLYEESRTKGFIREQLDQLLAATPGAARPVVVSHGTGFDRYEFLALPLLYGGELTGVLGLIKSKDGYDPVVLELLVPLASSCAALIQAAGLRSGRSVARKLLASQEERLRLILRTAADCFIEVSPDGLVTEWNLAAEHQLKLPRAEALGRAVNSLVTFRKPGGESAGLLDHGAASTVEPGRVHEVLAVLPDGTQFDAELAIWSVENAGGRSLCAFIRNVSQRKQLDEQQQLRFQSEMLLKEVHHRVKNNLQVIASLLTIQSSKLADGEQRNVFLECRERISAMSLIHDRLYSTRNYEQIDFGDYLREMVSLITSSNRPAGTDIRVNLEAESLQVPVDRAVPLSLIATELVLNSLKHGFVGRAGGILTVRLRREGTSCTLFVGDDGPGLETNGPQPPGVGLQLVEVLAGQIRARREVRTSPPDAGTFITWES